MARTKDLWTVTVKGPDGKLAKKHTARYGNGKRWLAVWNGPDGREQTKAFAKKTEADRYGAAQETDAARGTYVNPRRGAELLREYGERVYLPSLVHLRPNSAATYTTHLRKHVWPLLGDRQMRTLGRGDGKAFVTAKSAELAPTTVETVYAVLRALGNAAVDDGVIPVNPFARVPLPKKSPRVLEPLEPAAVLALADALPPRLRVALALAAGAGLRFGEATGLTVPRVDFLRRRVQVLEQAQNGALAPLKTKASRRTVPVGEWVLQEVSAHMQRYGPGPGQLVMSNAAGRVVQRNAFGESWRAAVEAAGLPRGTRYHDLRHFFASALIAANLNPKVIQARLGHATIAETMDTYGHLFPDSEELGRGAVDDALAAAQAEQGRNRAAQ
ncbi:MAG: tyrosine-type recombinase/integrase [Streptosporangiaceae bacterium]